MLEVLIVEDDSSKLKTITEALSKVDGFTVDRVTHVTDSYRARLALRERYYDLLILDISIPDRINQAPQRDGGLRLLDDVLDRPGYNIPGHVVGITAYDDIYTGSSDRFQSRLLTILQYKAEEAAWQDALAERVRHIVMAKISHDSRRRDYGCFMAICCALNSPELEMVRRLPWDWKQHPVEEDHTIYYRGEIAQGKERKMVYASAAARMGMPATAVLATKMITKFRPEYLVMTGITAGVKGKTTMGDIVIANPAYDWGNGKWVSRDDQLLFEPAQHQISLDRTLRASVEAMVRHRDTTRDIEETWSADLPETRLAIHLGPMASGAAVIADGVTVEQIRQRQRDLLAVEMETYALYLAAEEAPEPRPKALALKGVVDFGDPEKADSFQRYAAHVSAQALRLLVERYLLASAEG